MKLNNQLITISALESDDTMDVRISRIAPIRTDFWGHKV
jgi:hypothetical protein